MPKPLRSDGVEDNRYAEDAEPTCPEDHSHSSWCYTGHGCRCRRCRDAWSESRRRTYRTRQVRHNQSVMIGSAPIVRRLRALAMIGYGARQIAELADMNYITVGEIRRGERRRVHESTAKAVVEVYRRLHMTPSLDPGADTVRKWAVRMGYKSPLHWADIDRGIADEDE